MSAAIYFNVKKRQQPTNQPTWRQRLVECLCVFMEKQDASVCFSSKSSWRLIFKCKIIAHQSPTKRKTFVEPNGSSRWPKCFHSNMIIKLDRFNQVHCEYQVRLTRWHSKRISNINKNPRIYPYRYLQCDGNFTASSHCIFVLIIIRWFRSIFSEIGMAESRIS